MKILILGTSNSILKGGYTYGLNDALGEYQIDNMSVGASPGVQFLSLIGMNFSIYDCVVFDSVPNDEQYAYQTPGYQYDSENKDMLYDLFRVIRSQTQLIVVAFPVINFFQEPSQIYIDRMDLANSVGAHFLDVASILSFINKWNENIYSEHPAHPNVDISYKIGLYLGEAFKLLKKYNIPTCPVKNISERYKTIDITDFNREFEVKNYSNSFTSGSFSRLGVDDEIEFSGSDRMVGFYINASSTNCYIELKTTDDKRLAIPLLYARKPGKLLNLFVPLPGSPCVSSLKVVVDKNQDILCKPRMVLGVKDDEEPSLEISKVLLRDGSKFSRFINNEGCSFITEFVISRIATSSYFLSGVNFDNEFACINTHHGTCLFYNFSTHRLEHKKLDGIKSNILIHSDEKYIRLYVFDSGKIFPLVVESGRIISKSGVDSASMFSISYVSDENFYFKFKDKYVSATPDKGVVVNRDVARNWERFKLS